MTGPEHYLRAESLLETTAHDDPYRAYHLRAAQVHATLALAAAHVAGLFLHPDTQAAWDHAAGRADDPEMTR
jgi:hypothetical protein